VVGKQFPVGPILAECHIVPSMPKGTKKAIWICLSLPILLVVGFFGIAILNPFHRHEHCIKNTGLALRIYSTDHGGHFPFHTNGFGNALLLLIGEGSLGDTNGVYSVNFLTGPGDNGDVFRKALKTGEAIPEEKCSRIYIQGLSETNNPQIALVFDKKPTRGGDHFRRPWGPYLREVCMLDGSMEVVREEKWPAFASNQVELLVQEGIPRARAEHYYPTAGQNSIQPNPGLTKDR
jgi:hypothetical protein